MLFPDLGGISYSECSPAVGTRAAVEIAGLRHVPLAWLCRYVTPFAHRSRRAVMTAVVKVCGCRPHEGGAAGTGLAYANLQGRCYGAAARILHPSLLM
jgi:hypothetical protein